MIALPVSCDNLSVYIIDNYDTLEIKNSKQLTEYVNAMEHVSFYTVLGLFGIRDNSYHF